MTRQLSITKRFQFLIFALFGLGIVIAGIGGYSLLSLNRAMSSLATSTRLNELAVQSMVAAKEMQSDMRGYLLNPSDPNLLKRKIDADEENEKIVTEMKTLTSDPELAKIFDEQSTFDAKELNPREDRVAELIKSRQFEEARHAYVSELIPLQSKFDDLGTTLVKKTDAAAEHAIAAARSDIIRLTTTLVVIAVLGIAALAVGVLISVRSVIEALKKLVRVLSAGADQVASAATEISATSEELSSAANEQAASIQETASSVDEVNAMVKKNAENAEESGQAVHQSQDSANKGKEVVQDMIAAMGQIDSANAQIMTQIDQSNQQIQEIVKVISEIADKTKVINDIVFQTKLLSFNASIEAARAGEQGKGFAVVAEEVGNLAHMSGNAANEIADMLDHSIRKVESIVSETKTNVEKLIADGKSKVETGTGVARKTAQVLDEIVDSVSSVARMVAEISNASRQQAQGIEEITKAVGQIDAVTQQNAAASQQASSAAQSLSKEADLLRSGVNDLVTLIGVNDQNEQNTTLHLS